MPQTCEKYCKEGPNAGKPGPCPDAGSKRQQRLARRAQKAQAASPTARAESSVAKLDQQHQARQARAKKTGTGAAQDAADRAALKLGAAKLALQGIRQQE